MCSDKCIFGNSVFELQKENYPEPSKTQCCQIQVTWNKETSYKITIKSDLLKAYCVSGILSTVYLIFTATGKDRCYYSIFYLQNSAEV